MDWSDVALSAVSALVGALVPLVTIRTVTVQRARAARAETARLEVQQIVEPLRNALAQYEYVGHPEARRSGNAHMDDHAAVVRIRTAAAGLRPWRRALVERRCRRVFGRYWFDLAREYPSGDSLHSWLIASIKDREVRQGSGPTDGLFHRAYCRPAGDPSQRRLRRELRRLARSL